MSTKQSFEKIARNTWLAGLGSIETSIELISKSIDNAQKQSTQLYNELLTQGTQIQSKINDTTGGMTSKGKSLFKTDANHSHEQKLEKLNAKVEQLTKIVDDLIEKKAEQAPVRKAATVKKAAPKRTSARKAAVTTNKTSESKSAAPKPK
ncbi:hypothetical protein PN836_000920 [Ningiella sp. W23]|uniref:hypothetical protein n=1 Tax=Ningiella sp. W23 TaxID=3023715 RepID=UPI003757D8C6